MKPELEVANYSVDGTITELKYKHAKELFDVRTLSFRYFNKKLLCTAIVVFTTDKPKVNLWQLALKFIKRLK